MLCCKDPRATYKQLDLPLGIQLLIMLYKLFSPEKSAFCKRLLMHLDCVGLVTWIWMLPKSSEGAAGWGWGLAQVTKPRIDSQYVTGGRASANGDNRLTLAVRDTRDATEWGREVEYCKCNWECKGIGSRFQNSWKKIKRQQQTC